MNARSRLRVGTWIGLGLAAMLAACGGGGDDEKDGACVFTYKLDANVALCEDGYAAGECSGAADANYGTTFSSGASCAGLGYTLTCTGDPPGMFRRTCP